MPKLIHLIVACSANRVIGRDGRLPWSIHEDTAYFRRQTNGHTVILGRRSFEEWTDARAHRDVIVVTSTPRPPAIDPRSETDSGSLAFASTLTQALDEAQDLRGEIYLCGGQRIYEEGLLIATGSLFLTLIHAHVTGDTFFPEWRDQFPREIFCRESCDDRWRYAFMELGR